MLLPQQLSQRLTKLQLALALLFTVTLSLVLLLSSLSPGNAQNPQFSQEGIPSLWYPHPLATASQTKPQLIAQTITAQTTTQIGPLAQSNPDDSLTLANGFQPRMIVRPANPTNYGPRFTQDIDGNPVSNPLIVVLHETVGSGSSAINTIQAAQPDESRQVSYHAIVLRDGTVVLMVPPEYRAFGAGNSVFVGTNGAEAVRTHPRFPASVNNFAYHISLETPADGNNNGAGHSGYTRPQYLSLSWLVARTGVPEDRITTHREVDRSGQRRDPRSFNRQFLVQILRSAGATS